MLHQHADSVEMKVAAATSQGRNRRCITLNLHKEEGRDVLRRLSDRADVLVENFRPGVMEKWGLGPEVKPAPSAACMPASCACALGLALHV